MSNNVNDASESSLRQRHRVFLFRLDRLNVSELYNRWLVSFGNAVNDAQLFATLFVHYRAFVDHGPASEPKDVPIYEGLSIVYHAMAHTFEALVLLFGTDERIAPIRQREVRAVCQSERSKSGADLEGEIKTLRQLWMRHQGAFGAVRNLMVAHYADPVGTLRSTQEVEEYWQRIDEFVKRAGQPNAPMYDGTIIMEDRTDEAWPMGARYRNAFVDVLQEAYLDDLFHGSFWRNGSTQGARGAAVAEFLDNSGGV